MSLRANDLKDMIHSVFEIDSYASKLGNDEDIITVSFSLKEHEPAKDLMSFLEKGYSFILDADVTSSEQSDGTYKVFVELERNRHAPGNITEIVNGVKNLSGLDVLRFRYYKSFKSVPSSEQALEDAIPTEPSNYGMKVNETNLDNYKNFFNRSFVDNISLLENRLTIKKIYADPLSFEFVDFGNTLQVYDQITESMSVNDFAEVIYMCKYIGDYNISKYGNKFIFENQDKALVLRRIV